MYNSNIPTEAELPSSEKLIKSTIIAAAVAGVLAVTVVLPSEYGVDPTGVGSALGLKSMGEIKNSGSSAANIIASGTVGDERTDEFTNMKKDVATIDVPLGGQLEYKFDMNKGDRMIFEWAVEEGEIYYDFHGEPEGDTTGFYESFADSTGRSALGTFTAPFTGSHGWYFRNESDGDLKVILSTKGTYKITGVK
ncbi:hypothetical protein [Pseudemcibacter aquimaris]|uniref:hypothetical protein n=1 Tax=Pseudemcibacter aquimaris TaxID=2857064 RepID=UPI00201210EB|nr:hypothetical protein [Pseudemcibacter aquimaris]MCC3860167.1 hypothetical protein [Pseudemcibacter aquimaris]WDU57494.1 hypothetical protein KW060_09830 [Pseudemcibacter aquimaris]